MSNRNTTMALAAVLNKLAIDIRIEYTIDIHEAPEVTDAYAVLLAAWRLAEHGIDVPNVKLDGDMMTVVSCIPLSDYNGGKFCTIMTFNKDLLLVSTSVDIQLDAALTAELKAIAGQAEHVQCLSFKDVDMHMLVPTNALLGSLTYRIYAMLFNTPYRSDLVSLAGADYTAPTINRLLCINGQAYTVLVQGPIDVVDVETGIVDFILVQAFQLVSGNSHLTNLNLLLDEETGVVFFDTECLEDE